MQDGIELIKEIGKLQKDYGNLVSKKMLTKKAMCDLVIPFRDKYCLSDRDALAIARNEINIDKIARLIEDGLNKHIKE